MSIISPADLEASPLADLHALASALGIDGFRRLRKEELVEAILARQGAAAPRRSRAGSRRAAAQAPQDGDDDTPPVDDAAEEPSVPRGRGRAPGPLRASATPSRRALPRGRRGDRVARGRRADAACARARARA